MKWHGAELQCERGIMKRAERSGWRCLWKVVVLCVGVGSLAGFVACHSGPGALSRTDGTAAEQQSVKDVRGVLVDPFEDKNAKARVFIFVRTDCPISNRYAPEIERLFRRYQGEGIRFWLVYPEDDVEREGVADHLAEYRLSLPALLDPGHVLVKKAKVEVTPEVAVFDQRGRLSYRGRIDNRFVDFGKERAAPTERDLDIVLQAILQNKSIQRSTTTAVGCYISPQP